MAGGFAGCEHEPSWQRLYSVIARPEDSQERKAQAMVAIRELKPKCQKLLMNPTACHGCEHSPIKDSSDESRNLFQIYSGLLSTTARMVDAAKFGWLKSDEITALEFSLMRLYEAALQSRRSI